MIRRSTCSSIVSLSLVFILAGLVACSKGSEGEETPAPSTEAGVTPAPGAPAQQPGQTTMPPSSAQPGAMPSGPPVDTSALPAVVARVNGVEITKADLLRQVEQMRAMGQARGRQLPPMDANFYKQLLDGVVAQTLILQDAKAQSVNVTDAEVEAQIAAMRSRLPAGATFEKALGMNEAALKTFVREQATVQKYMMTVVFNQMAVSEEQEREFYEQNKAQMQRPERVHLRHILIRVEPNAAAADKQKAKAKAEDLLKQAQGGADFAKLASESSEDPNSKVNGGDLSWIMRGQAPPPFEQAAFALTKPNQLSPVVESPAGYHIIQLVEREAPSAVSFEEAKGRIDQMLKQRQASQKGQAKVEELKRKGKVEVFL